MTRFLIDDFISKGFNKICFLPGGFEECHEIALQTNMDLVNHETSKSCFHCAVKGGKNNKGWAPEYE